MDNNSPISNIPQLFTHYRTKILEESGQTWFHLDNHASPEAIAPPSQTSSTGTPSSSITMGTTIYEYPDPWITQTVVSESSQLQTHLENHPVSESTVDSSSSHPSHNVNLFPLGDTTQDTRHSLYDLTEFDNGEIEVPPVASRDLQPAKFEKIDPIQSTSSDTLSVSFDSTAPNNRTLNFRKAINAKTASAEIAKFRLRNCL